MTTRMRAVLLLLQVVAIALAIWLGILFFDSVT
jgi:hypothetical protein